MAPPCRSLIEQEESFPPNPADESTPLGKNWGVVCSGVSCAVLLRCTLSLSMMINKPKYLGSPCSLEYPGVPSSCGGSFPWIFHGPARAGFHRVRNQRAFCWTWGICCCGSGCPGAAAARRLCQFSSSRKALCCAWREGPGKLCASLESRTASRLHAGRGWDAVSAPVSRKYPQSSAHAAVPFPVDMVYCPATGRFFLFPLK